MSTILENALKIDLGNRLQSFETEFWVMEELSSSFPVDLDAPDLESMNEALRKQNRALIEQLAIAHGAIRNLEDAVQELQQKFEAQLLSSKLDRYVSTLCAFAIRIDQSKDLIFCVYRKFKPSNCLFSVAVISFSLSLVWMQETLNDHQRKTHEHRPVKYVV